MVAIHQVVETFVDVLVVVAFVKNGTLELPTQEVLAWEIIWVITDIQVC